MTNYQRGSRNPGSNRYTLPTGPTPPSGPEPRTYTPPSYDISPYAGSQPNFSQAYNPARNLDFYQVTAPYYVSRGQPHTNVFRSYQVKGTNAVRWEMYFRDLSGGLDLMQTEIGPGYFPNKLMDSDLEHRYPGTLCLFPLEESNTTAGVLLGSPENISSAYLRQQDNDVLFVGAGSTINQALFALGQDASGNMTVTAKTYTPTSIIEHIAPIIIGGNVPERLCVLRKFDPPQVLTALVNAAPTVSGTMHAALDDSFWLATSPLNATAGTSTLIFGAANTIATLASTAAIGDAPTTIMSNVPDGFAFISILEIDPHPVGIYLAWPRETNPDNESVYKITDNDVDVFDIMRINLEGSDPSKIDVGLDYCTHVKAYRGGLLCTDGDSATWLMRNGTVLNLSAGRERERGSAAQVHITCIEVIGDRALFGMSETNAAGAVVARWWEEYDPERDSPYKASPRETLTAGTVSMFLRSTDKTPYLHYSAPGNVNTPIFRFYWYQTDATAGWKSFGLLPATINPFYWQNTGEVFRFFEPGPNTAKTPVYHFYEGFPKCVSDIWYGGELKGEDSKVEIEVATQSASAMSFTGNQSVTFNEDDDWYRHFWVNPEPELTDRIQFQITVTQGTSGTGVTRTTPNALPFMVGGFVYLDNQYIAPQQLEGWRFQRMQE